MTSLAARIEDIAATARESGDETAAITELVDLAQHRGGRTGRRLDGAYFTDADVAEHLVRRAIAARLLESTGLGADDIDDALAANRDLRALLAERCAAEPDARDRARALVSRLVVLDPSCGAGSFLVAAWHELDACARILGADAVSPDQLHGVDLDPEAAAACRAVLDLVTDRRRPAARIIVADAERAGSLPSADIVVGNPPFVRATASDVHDDLATRSVPNRSAWIVERALAVARPLARTAFVLPISTSCTDAFAPARDAWSVACDRILASHFDAIPSSLFRGVVQRLSILEGRVRGAGPPAPARWWTTRFHRWTAAERPGLLASVRHVPLPPHSVAGSMAKVGTAVESGLLERMFHHPPAARLFGRAAGGGTNQVLYKRRWSYFLLFTDFIPPMWDGDGKLRPPSELKFLDVIEGVDARALAAVFSSSLFWWYFSVFTDNRNVNRRDLEAFPLPRLDRDAIDELEALGAKLMDALRACAEVRTCTYRSIGTIRNTYFRQGETRPVLDRVDAVLAKAYGMTEAEHEFVVGFERRFRR